MYDDSDGPDYRQLQELEEYQQYIREKVIEGFSIPPERLEANREKFVDNQCST